ncbi:3-coathanger stack domain-containing protein [Acidobacteriota bacterium]
MKKFFFILILIFTLINGLDAQTVDVSVFPSGPINSDDGITVIEFTITFTAFYDEYPCKYTFQVCGDNYAVLQEYPVFPINDFSYTIFVNIDPSTDTDFYLFRGVIEWSSDFFDGCGEFNFSSEDEKKIYINHPPTIPTGLTYSNVTEDSFEFCWSPSSDPEGDAVTYQVYKNSSALDSPTSYTCYNVNGLSFCTSYNMSVKAIDSQGSESDMSSILSVETDCCASDVTVTSSISGGTEEFLASNTITADNQISGGAIVHYGAGNSVKLVVGFKVSTGCSFHADLIGCD